MSIALVLFHYIVSALLLLVETSSRLAPDEWLVSVLLAELLLLFCIALIAFSQQQDAEPTLLPHPPLLRRSLRIQEQHYARVRRYGDFLLRGE